MDVLVPEVLFYYGVVNRHVLLCIVDTKTHVLERVQKSTLCSEKNNPLCFRL